MTGRALLYLLILVSGSQVNEAQGFRFFIELSINSTKHNYKYMFDFLREYLKCKHRVAEHY